MFENSNTVPTPKLPPAKSASLQCRSSSGMSLRGQSTAFEWVGGNQHLKHLSKTVGTKVSDFLRRKESSSHSSLGVTEVNESAEAALSAGGGTLLSSQDQAERQVPIDSIPQLSPPPLITKKRTPRALKTTQDMLIASQPSMKNTDGSIPEESQGGPCQAARTEEWEAQEDGTSPRRAFGVPDLIHKDNLEPKLNTAYRICPISCAENSALSLISSPDKSLPECLLQSNMDPSKANISTLESEGHSPDLLSFE
ncbi:uncharacterized protein C1orf226 homolog [Hemicordylus capensis]|uniref:uncharacterized protein C1orf226 homolog n=1 Tax=Hemicordylus capensis TaxID=884348 RepID=UPI0023034DBF|nr:uncharacterized protein C1orf226 homolog [Hemicordylus capensis]